ncbi:hypothetical protein DICVIV_07358 [Dictyocaulus viviparus]|uniref:Neurotransmitter-gated ion-channel ligand-binding domain-containing protein n=1 Tax=Dictyocaulus viviparus TaxID=29172 RepID=A0A0D8XPV1_DICVI|nr:hypothetical protein DICVIV_07358 [Dictyocaulus viviparus]
MDEVHLQHRRRPCTVDVLHHWYDHRLSWNPNEYGGIRNFYVPGEMIWLPDIILYNKEPKGNGTDSVVEACFISSNLGSTSQKI